MLTTWPAFWRRMQPEVRVGMFGYSYGARIIAGGLHLLGGGELLGLTVAPGQRAASSAWRFGRRRNTTIGSCRAAITAWPCRKADQWLITRNCCDPALARYRWVEKCYNPVALGYSGLVGRNLLSAEQNARIEELDVTQPRRRHTHDNDAYLYSRADRQPDARRGALARVAADEWSHRRSHDHARADCLSEWSVAAGFASRGERL